MTKVLKVANVRTVVRSPATVNTVLKVADIGNAGPPGASGGNYTHIQSSPSTTWTITHNLGYNPGGVSVVDSAGSKMYGDVMYVNTNQIVVNFSAGFSGKAYIS
jgi:hypothetical protein